jgi:hypothetical protein
MFLLLHLKHAIFSPSILNLTYTIPIKGPLPIVDLYLIKVDEHDLLTIEIN